MLFTVPCALAAPQNSPVSSPAVLPQVTAYALDRAKVTLPADFAAPLNLLILSFQRDQQSVVDGWLPQVEQLPGARALRWSLDVDPLELF